MNIMDELRRPLFITACLILVAVVLIELGSSMVSFIGLASPGKGIPAMAMVDGVLLFTIAFIAIPLIVTESAVARTQGVITLIFSILLLLAAIVAIFVFLGLLFLMVGLLLALPFGPGIYAAMGFGSFNKGGAGATLTMLMTLKLVFAGGLLLSHQYFIKNKGLVLQILVSLGLVLLLSFLHGLVPGFIVSVTDVVGAIIMGIVAVIYAILFLISGIVSIVKVLT